MFQLSDAYIGALSKEKVENLEAKDILIKQIDENIRNNIQNLHYGKVIE